MKNELTRKELIELDYLKGWWLNTRGGRTIEDVKTDEQGEYVFMQKGDRGQDKVHIPSFFAMKRRNEEIAKERNNRSVARKRFIYEKTLPKKQSKKY
jgi:hypothetical protein